MWRDASQAVFFSEINLQDKSDINKLLRLFLVNNNIRYLIKTLTFDVILQHSTGFSMLRALDMQFPNLESLDFSGDTFLYISFTKIVTENGMFKSLRSLPTPKNVNQDGYYIQCIDSLKERITTIELFDDPTRNRDDYFDLREKLPNFSNLEEIVVHSNKEMFSIRFMRCLANISNK